MQKQITVKVLHEQGEKISTIARLLKCHRNTVRNIINRKVKELQIRNKSSAFTSYEKEIKDSLDKKISRKRIYEELTKQYPIPETYDALCKFIKVHNLKPKEAFGPQEHLPGDAVELDFGELGKFLFDEKWVKVFALVIVLPFSKKIFVLLCVNQTLETVCQGLTAAFNNFGGTPKQAKVDNMKTAVIINTPQELVFNQDFVEFLAHYSMTPIACEPYSPEQKGTVESGVKFVQQNFIAGRTFTDLADMKRQLTAWIEKQNKRIHGTTKRQPDELFISEEKPKLRPLPKEEFSFFNREERKVGQNCLINFKNNFYSVPFSYIDKTVTIRWNSGIVRVIYRGEEIALHERNAGLGNFVTKREHFPPWKTYSHTEFQSKHENKMREIGPSATHYFNMLLVKKPRHWAEKVRGIYGLVKEYGPELVDKALRRALLFEATDIGTIRNILEKKLYLLPETEEMQFTDSSNSRDTAYYL